MPQNCCSPILAEWNEEWKFGSRSIQIPHKLKTPTGYFPTEIEGDIMNKL